MKFFHALTRSLLLTFLLVVLLLVPIASLASDELSLSPLWQPADTYLLLGGITFLGIAALADQPIDDRARSNQTGFFSESADALHLLGHPLATFSLAGGIWGYGLLVKNEALIKKGHLALESVLVSQVATLALKYTLGRQRPDGDNNPGTFSPFSFATDKDSFPSGHTAGAFALASVLASASDQVYSRYGYYALAGLVGASRIYRGDHWASDVVAGALVGELAARLTRRLHHDHHRTLLILPWVDHGAGLQLSMRF